MSEFSYFLVWPARPSPKHLGDQMGQYSQRDQLLCVDIVETHGYVQECQWAYTPAFEQDNVATTGFDQDVSAAKAFVS